MKVLVAFESSFGNTAEVARAVADGLGERMDVGLQQVTGASGGERFDLVVAVVRPTRSR